MILTWDDADDMVLSDKKQVLEQHIENNLNFIMHFNLCAYNCMCYTCMCLHIYMYNTCIELTWIDKHTHICIWKNQSKLLTLIVSCVELKGSKDFHPLIYNINVI